MIEQLRGGRLLPRGYSGPVLTPELAALDSLHRAACPAYESLISIAHHMDLRVSKNTRIHYDAQLNLNARIRREGTQYPFTPEQQQLFSAIYFSLESSRREQTIAFAFPWCDDDVHLAAYVHGGLPRSKAELHAAIDIVAAAFSPALRDLAWQRQQAKERMATMERPLVHENYGTVLDENGKEYVFRRSLRIEDIVEGRDGVPLL